MKSKHDSVLHVVIAGAGFAGLNAAKVLARERKVRLTIIDRTNHHLFQPLLYQVSMAELNPSDIATPIRAFFRRRKNVEVVMGEVTRVDPDARCLHTTAGLLEYDYLVLATGSRHMYFGHDEWEAFAPGLKTLEQATEIRRRVLLAFEKAERAASPEALSQPLTFVIVGGGPTGVELAGAIGEMARHSLRREFRKIDPRATRVILLEGGNRILAGFHPDLIARAMRDLEALGVEVRLNTMVTEIDADGVRAGDERIAASTVLWAAGVAPSSLGRQLGVACDRGGRVVVEPDLSVPGHPEIFVAGDLAHVANEDGEPLPGVGGVALQEGVFIGKLLRRELRGAASRKHFRYHDKGSMATIGHNKAIAEIGRLRLGGYPAWLAWVFIHIYYLTGFHNRVFVMLQWAWAYFTRRRNMRLILGKGWRFYGDK
ncbi:MAG TPA: NAD(P)/FAD-dependent oxidoreductase [Gammaproteobacteria bacterium]